MRTGFHSLYITGTALFLSVFSGVWMGTKPGAGELGSGGLLGLNHRQLVSCSELFWLWSRRRRS